MAISRHAADIYSRAVAGKSADIWPSDGSEWVSVQLDNLKPPRVSGHEFAGYLSALERAGLYYPDYDGFGRFLLKKGEP